MLEGFPRSLGESGEELAGRGDGQCLLAGPVGIRGEQRALRPGNSVRIVSSEIRAWGGMKVARKCTGCPEKKSQLRPYSKGEALGRVPSFSPLSSRPP